jgi:hypothetical protein
MHAAIMKGDRSALKTPIGKSLGRSRRRREDNIKKDLKEIGV